MRELPKLMMSTTQWRCPSAWNGKVDKALFLPTEGFGFSRDAKARFGPPRFSSAAFRVDSSAPVYQTIRMRYLGR